MFKKTIKTIVVIIAGLIALAYAFNMDYLFKGIRETYLRGELSATIDDGAYFSSHAIVKGNPIFWEKDSLYNQKKLSKILEDNLVQTKTAAFVIIKKGKILHEQYWDSYTAKSATNSFSMAKTINVMLLGKAIDDGKIKSLDQKYSDFYQNYEKVPFGENLTLRNLASMEAGLNWDENYKNPFKPNANLYYGKSLAEAVFLRGLNKNPGTKFEYQSGASQLLGFAIRKAVNQPLASYLSQKFWKPLGMEHNATWSTDDNGMEKTFCCVHSNARDFAKLGYLLLNKGKFRNLQLINPHFVEQMITPTKNSGETYGLGIWINNDNPIKHYFFWGLQGQYIIVVPELDMVIVRTGSYKDQPKNDRGRPDQVKFLVNEIAKNF